MAGATLRKVHSRCQDFRENFDKVFEEVDTANMGIYLRVSLKDDVMKKIIAYRWTTVYIVQ